MSENDKEKQDFEFIKEQVIEKKKSKMKKRWMQLLMTFVMAIIFGLTAAFVFAIAEPGFCKLLNNEDKEKQKVCIPSNTPDEQTSLKQKSDKTKDKSASKSVQTKEDSKDPVIVEKSIDADIGDYVNIYEDLKVISNDVNRSLIKVNSIIKQKDWFNKTVYRTIKTTGVIIGNNGVDLLMLVSFDRVQDASSIKLQLTENTIVNARLLDYESDLNLAVIAAKLNEIPEVLQNSLKIAKLGDSYTLSTGSPILALGSPNGHQLSEDIGIITSKGYSISVTDNRLDLFNTNINDNKNGDGIIVNMNGEVIGIITRTLKNDGDEDLNTVLGISKIKKIIELLANHTPRIYCGIKSEDMTDTAKQEHEISNGIYVNEVLVNSPAYYAGFKNGDIILQVNDTNVLNSNHFYNIISEQKPGDKVKIKIKRTSGTVEKEIIIKVNLVEKKK